MQVNRHEQKYAAPVFYGIIMCITAAATGPSAASRLRVEYMEAPLGVDVGYPLRFTWSAGHSDRNQGQSAYQLVVERSSGAHQQAVVWDSGKTASNFSQNVPLGIGIKLAADTAYTWTVRWWDRHGAASANTSSTFSTGLYVEADWKGAQWIGGQIGQYRKAFAVKGAVVRATAYVIGLGYFKLHMNGKQVSTHELGAFTTFERRVLYNTLDLTEAVNAGLAGKEQAIGMVLGNGWYNLGSTDPFDGGHPISVGPPSLRLRLSLHYADGTAEDLVSDTSWMHTAGPVTAAHIYVGTTYNATYETLGWTSEGYDASDWSATTVVRPPSDHVKLTSHAVMPLIRTTQTFAPCKIWQSSPEVYVFDFCQNMAGYARLRVPEGVAMEPNVAIEMFHAEAIHGPPENNSAIFNHYTSKRFELNTYVTRGDGAEIDWSPSFTYAGFRYIQLTGYPGTPDSNTLTAHFIHTYNEDIGSVSFSDSNLDAVQHITRKPVFSELSAHSPFRHLGTPTTRCDLQALRRCPILCTCRQIVPSKHSKA
jgi:alpha-L-rhamnosidase